MSFSFDLRHTLGAFSLDVSFTVRQPRVIALFGPSGSGKSSTLAALAGLLKPDHGKISLGGEMLTDTAGKIFVPPHRRRIGTVFQDSRLFPHLSVAGNLAFAVKRSRTALTKTERADLLHRLDITHLLQRRPAGLSGGETQRVALARALVGGPRLLALDEPMAALDSARRQEILPHFEALRDVGTTPILYISHQVEEVARLADDLVILEAGRVRAQGSAQDLFARPDLVPILGADQAGALVDADVIDHADGLCRLACGAGEVVVEHGPIRIGARTRLHIRARDVMLALDPPERISANNILPATVTAIEEGVGPVLDVVLDSGGTGLLSRITRISAERLALRPGQSVYAVVKSVTLHRGLGTS